MVVGEVKASLDISAPPHSEPEWAGMCQFNNMAEALNEIINTYYPLCGGGHAETEVTGMHPVYTFTGQRKRGDKLQDWLYDPERKYAIGDARKSKFKIEAGNEKGQTVTVEAPCTLCNLMEFSGATTEESAVSVEVHLNAKPTVNVA